MKIALITMHWANNYGASLQTFATIKVLERYGDVTLLDYRNAHAAKGMQVIRWGIKPRDVLRMAKDLFRLVPRARVIGKFEAFTRTLPLSERLTTNQSFQALENRFDAFVCGSDQIWNPAIVSETNTLDTHFLLDFVTDKPRLSYASSMGTYVYDSQQAEEVRYCLSRFSGLSVREQDTADYLTTLLQRQVETVVDPTLLLTHEQWLQSLEHTLESFVPANRNHNAFILVYALKKDAQLKAVIEYYRYALGFEVICIDQDPFLNYVPDLHLKDASPSDFVELFNQAAFVITNSFHGVCFSVNFNKSFVVTEPPTGRNRILNLLEQVELQARFIAGPDLPEIDTIDWDKVNGLLDASRQRSIAYLNNQLAAATGQH
jgi:hypothetical protein